MTRATLFVFVISLFLANCHEKADQSQNESTAEMAAPRIMQYSSMALPSSDQKTGDDLTRQRRMVIHTATIEAEVAQYDTALTKLQRVAESMGGFVLSTSTRTEKLGRRSGEVVLRIPSDNFEKILTATASLSQRVVRQAVRGNDITEEFYDLTARLENKQKIERRYREILRSAKKVEDVLAVETYLGTVREEIERLEGRKRYLSDQAVLSTVTVEFHEPYDHTEEQHDGFWSKIIGGFKSGVRGLGDVTATTIAIVISSTPVIIIVGALLWLILRVVRRLRAVKRNGASVKG